MAIPSTVLDFLARLERAGMGNLTASATAGSTARLVATVVMAPLELERTRAQSHGGGSRGEDSSNRHCVTTAVRHQNSTSRLFQGDCVLSNERYMLVSSNQKPSLGNGFGSRPRLMFGRGEAGRA